MSNDVCLALAFGAVLTATGAIAEEDWQFIQDRTVVGRWTFDGTASEQLKDSSGYGSDITTVLPSGMSILNAGDSGYDGFDGSGYLEITSAGATLTATLKNGEDVKADSTHRYTVAARFKATCGNISKISGFNYKKENAFIDKVNDHSHWHDVVMRYQSGSGSYGSTAWRALCDPVDMSGDSYPEVGNDTQPLVPIVVGNGGKSVQIGGQIGMPRDGYCQDFTGSLEEVLVVNRMLTLGEITRLYLTGETYIYPDLDYLKKQGNNQVPFEGYGGWSCSENNYKPVPGDVLGAAYILDNGAYLNAPKSNAVFGKSLGNKVSVTLGRNVAPYDVVNRTYLDGTLTGTINQQEGFSCSFYDLRLVRGSYTSYEGGDTSVGQRLHAEHLTVEGLRKTSSEGVEGEGHMMFSINRSAGLKVTGSARGDGCAMKAGAGLLDLSEMTGVIRILLQSGPLKLPSANPVLYDYIPRDATANAAIRLYVAPGNPVRFAAEAKAKQYPINLKIDGTISKLGKYELLKVPVGTVTITGNNRVALPDGVPLSGDLQALVSAGTITPTVSVTSDGTTQTAVLTVCYPGDDGESPMLIGE